jgi:hypothetical protein
MPISHALGKLHFLVDFVSAAMRDIAIEIEIETFAVSCLGVYAHY